MDRRRPRRLLSQSVLAFALLSASAAAQPLPPALCAGWQGERVCELLREDASVRMLRCTFPPGVGHEPHYHPPHFGYLLGEGGTMRIATENGVEDRALQSGSHFVNDSEMRHSALNVGQTTIRYLIVEKKYADARAAADVTLGLCAGAER
jgi:beta-alanine degradation protein BauB